MSLNPFIRVKLFCPVSADDARDRLREVTQAETPWTFTVKPFVRYQSSGHRYIGVIKGNEFRLVVKPYVPSGHTAGYADILWARAVTYHRDTILAIKGTIEPSTTGCTINLVFKPKGILFIFFPVWIAYIAYATIDLARRDGLQLFDAVPLMFLGFALFMLFNFYFSSYALEKDYLEALFTAEKRLTDSAQHAGADSRADPLAVPPSSCCRPRGLSS